MAKNLVKGILIGSVTVGGISYLFNAVGSVAAVDGISMQPALNPEPGVSDYIYLNKLSINRISRGDIVTLMSPKSEDKILVKRVVGLENDLICTKGYKSEIVKVPKGHCWVEGDNKEHSADSNSFGPVPLSLITGKADYIVWPPERWRSLKLKKEEKT